MSAKPSLLDSLHEEGYRRAGLTEDPLSAASRNPLAGRNPLAPPTARMSHLAAPDYPTSRLGMHDRCSRSVKEGIGEAHDGRRRSEPRVGRDARLPVGIEDVLGWGARGSGLRPVGWQPQVAEDALDDGRVLDQGHQPKPAPTPRAGEHVHPKRPPHQLRPQIAAPPPSCRIVVLVSDRVRAGHLYPTTLI